LHWGRIKKFPSGEGCPTGGVCDKKTTSPCGDSPGGGELGDGAEYLWKKHPAGGRAF